MLEKKSIKTGIVGADTSFLIDFFKGEKGAVEFMQKHAKLLRVSELVIYEFLCGNLTKEQKEMFFEAMQSFVTVTFNREAGVFASEMFRNAKDKGKEVGHQDCMIAGSYVAHGVKLIVTRNDKHFKNINEVDVVMY